MQYNTGYKIERIALIKSNFERENIISINPDSFKPNFDIKIIEGKLNDANKFTVGLNIVYTETVLDKTSPQIKADITFVGQFEKFGESKVTIENFTRVNAPAIIFPFIREHLATLSIKASLKPILLEPVNFFDLNKGEKEDKSS